MIIILLLIMLITVSTGGVVYNFANVAEVREEISLTEISAFNDPITQYEGRQLGSSVKSLLSYLISNAGNNSSDEDRLPDVTYNSIYGGPEFSIDGTDYSISGENNEFTIISDSSNTEIEAMSSLRANITQTHYYEIEVEYDNTTGLINEVIIIY